MLGGYDMVRRRVRHKSKAFNVFMMLLFVACLFVIGKQEYSIYQIKQEQAATQQRIAALKNRRLSWRQSVKVWMTRVILKSSPVRITTWWVKTRCRCL